MTPRSPVIEDKEGMEEEAFSSTKLTALPLCHPGNIVEPVSGLRTLDYLATNEL